MSFLNILGEYDDVFSVFRQRLQDLLEDPPWLPELEKGLMAAMLNQPGFPIKIVESLTVDFLHEPAHQALLLGIQAVKTPEEAVDQYRLCHYLRKEGLLQQVGGGDYLIELNSMKAEGKQSEDEVALFVSLFWRRKCMQLAKNFWLLSREDKHFSPRLSKVLSECNHLERLHQISRFGAPTSLQDIIKILKQEQGSN